MTTATIHIAIPTLGTRLPWLRQCLLSITELQLGTSPEISVVVPAARASAIHEVISDFEVRVIETNGATGLSDAINIAWLNRGSCQFFTWLGDDDLLAPGALGSVVAALEANPAAPFAYGNTRYIDGHNRTIMRVRATKWAWRYLRWGQDFVPQPGSLIRSGSVTSELLVDPSLKNSMDLELFLRLSSTGRGVPVYVNREVSAYRLHGESITAQKGSDAEGAMVRTAFRSSVVNGVAGRLSPVLHSFEKAYLYTLWHCSWVPRVPTVDGVEYLSFLRER